MLFKASIPYLHNHKVSRHHLINPSMMFNQHLLSFPLRGGCVFSRFSLRLIWVMIREPIPMLLAISLALAVAAVLGCILDDDEAKQ